MTFLTPGTYLLFNMIRNQSMPELKVIIVSCLYLISDRPLYLAEYEGELVL